MKEFLKKFMYSKRFIAFFISLLVFIILLLSTSIGPIELATGLAMLAGVYIGGQSIRPSNKHTEIG